MKDKVLVFFTRIPTLGKTKTRLEGFLSKDLCVKLQLAFIKDIYNNLKSMGIDIICSYSDQGDLGVLEDIIHDDICFIKQEGLNLGEKMHNALSFSLKNYKKAVLIGSDIPLINKEDIKRAFEILDTKDLVISPTYDGGYYLIGMKEENHEIFNMKYSTSSVFDETIDKMKELDKSYGIGTYQLDIDDKYDFLKLYEILKEDETISCDNTRELLHEIMEKREVI